MVDAVVYHRPGCTFYRGERDGYDQRESIAHLLAIGAGADERATSPHQPELPLEAKESG